MSGPIRLPFEPLTITTSPARRAATSGSRKAVRSLSPKGAAGGRRGVEERARERPSGVEQVDSRRVEVGSERRVKRRALIAELEHVADDRDAPPLALWLGRGQQRQRCAHGGGIGVVAFVDDDEGAVRAGKLEALAASLLRLEVL